MKDFLQLLQPIIQKLNELAFQNEYFQNDIKKAENYINQFFINFGKSDSLPFGG